MSRLFSKRQLANRFGYSPLIRLLLFNARFRFFVIAVVLIVAALLLAVPRIWNVAPPGSGKEVRINLIDMAQAWKLARTARELDKAGNHQGALISWAAAVANYPTKPEYLRGYLGAVFSVPVDNRTAQNAPVLAGALLEVTRTNHRDIELAARVYDRFRQPEKTVSLLRGLTNNLPPALEIILARALHETGNYAEFEAQWQTNEKVLATDPELVLRRASVQDLFGTEEEAAAARLILERAALSGTNRIIANRLLLRSAEKRRDPTAAQRALNTLVGLKADATADHLALWRVLMAADRSAEAGALIQAFNRLPATAAEAAQIYDLAMKSGQTRRADDLVDWALSNLGYSTAMCARKAAALIRNSAWADLRQLAIEIRLRSGISNTLRAYSHLIEGRASLGENLIEQAQREFARLGEFDYDEPEFALYMANSLIEIGQAAMALPLLSALEGKLETSIQYWLVCARAASAERNSVLLLRATERGFQMETNNLALANNYAAALVIQRSEPQLALELTSNLVQQLPAKAIPTLNHAGALLLNSRVAEASQWLARLDPAKLDPPEANQYHYLRFYAAIAARELEPARELLPKINPAELFPPQLTWLQAAVRSYLQMTNAISPNPPGSE